MNIMDKKTPILLLLGVLTWAVSNTTWANETLSDISPKLDLSSIEVTPHELALTQVLSEICPPLLNGAQKRKFTQAYQAQLKEFMPNLDPVAAMRQIGAQREYRTILSSIRSWTLSFPTAENKALCEEFSEISF